MVEDGPGRRDTLKARTAICPVAGIRQFSVADYPRHAELDVSPVPSRRANDDHTFDLRVAKILEKIARAAACLKAGRIT